MGTATFLGAKGRLRNPNPNTDSPESRRRRQRFPAESYRRGGASPTSSPGVKNLVMGQVKILKRGEPLVVPPAAASAPRRKSGTDLALGSTDRLGPDPELVRFQIRVKELKRVVVDGTYAGSGFFESPPPSSVPVPGFLVKKSFA